MNCFSMRVSTMYIHWIAGFNGVHGESEVR